jgi:hypothetical protein
MIGCKAHEILRNVAYSSVRRNNEEQVQRSRRLFFNSLPPKILKHCRDKTDMLKS